jgi:hypothetical protein
MHNNCTISYRDFCIKSNENNNNKKNRIELTNNNENPVMKKIKFTLSILMDILITFSQSRI